MYMYKSSEHVHDTNYIDKISFGIEIISVVAVQI
jgi:hypothetical protein